MRRLMTIALLTAFVLVSRTTWAETTVQYVGAISEDLASPTGLALGADRIAVSEPLAQRITLYTADGIKSQRLDITGDAIGLAALSPTAYLVCNRETNDIVLIDFTTGTQSIWLPAGVATEPVDLVADAFGVRILDAARNAIVVTGRDGALRETVTLTGPDAESLPHAAVSFAYDAAHSRYLVFDQTTSRVLVYGTDGTFQDSFASFGAGDGQITRGGGIACDGDGYVYISDRFQGRVAVFNDDFEFVTNIDPVDYGHEPFRVPTGIAVDADGMLYAASTEDRRIHIFHIEKGEAAGRLPQAQHVWPANNDTLPAGGLTLTAGVTIGTESLPLTGIDFQLVAASDTSVVLREVTDVATEPYSGSDNAQTASWELEGGLSLGSAYAWRVRARSGETVGQWSSFYQFTLAGVIGDYRLEQNYPNPFNPQTTIAFYLPRAGDATLTVYNLMGQTVTTLKLSGLSAGRHLTEWNGTDGHGRSAASGVYFYRLTAGDFTETRKMVLLR